MMTENKGLFSKIKGFFTFERGTVRTILALVLPVLVSTLLSTSYAMIDHMMAGRHSTHSLNAIGLINTPVSILTIFFVAINTGTTTSAAWNIGAGKLDKAHRVMHTSILLNIIFGLIVGMLGFIFAPELIGFMAGDEFGDINLPGTVAYDAVETMKIYSFGFVFMGISSAITSTLRGAGENMPPLIYSMSANFLNVIGNYVFIYGIGAIGIPEMGAQGAALSTALSLLLQVIFAFIFLALSKKSKFSFRMQREAALLSAENTQPGKLSLLIPDFAITKRILAIGIPSMFETIFTQLGIIMFSKMVISTGEISYAAHQVASSINSLFVNGCAAFSVAACTLMGQSLGAKNIEKAKYHTNSVVKIVSLVSLITCVITWLFANNLIALYTSDAEVAETTARLLTVSGLMVITIALQDTYSGALKGAGDTKFPLYVAIICTLLVRVTLTYTVLEILKLDILFVWLATLTDYLLRCIIFFVRYKNGRWEKYSQKAIE